LARTIVVALDGSKHSSRALEYAIYLARQYQAELFGIYVIPLFAVNLKKPSSKLAKIFVDDGKKTLEAAKMHCARNGVVFHEKITNGNEGFSIVSFAKKKNADVIVMGSRGRSGTKELFLGSVSRYVVHKAPMPVLVIK
jgi:nucleotide-binding universal stress UspA family protein